MSPTTARTALTWGIARASDLTEEWDIPATLWALDTSGPGVPRIVHRASGFNLTALVRDSAVAVGVREHQSRKPETTVLVLMYEGYTVMDADALAWDGRTPLADNPSARECRQIITCDEAGNQAAATWVRGQASPTPVLDAPKDSAKADLRGRLHDNLGAMWAVIRHARSLTPY